jgi:hypothetical protein
MKRQVAHGAEIRSKMCIKNISWQRTFHLALKINVHGHAHAASPSMIGRERERERMEKCFCVFLAFFGRGGFDGSSRTSTELVPWRKENCRQSGGRHAAYIQQLPSPTAFLFSSPLPLLIKAGEHKKRQSSM